MTGVRPRHSSRLWLAAAWAATLAACAPEEAPPDRLVLTPVSYRELPGWSDDSQAEALDALRRSCARLRGMPEDHALGAGGIAGTAALWREPCEALAAVPREDHAARRYFERWFAPFAASNNNRPEGLFTGYYEPNLSGSRTRSGDYTTPIYRLPDDLVMVDLGDFRDHLKGERIAGRVVDGRLEPFESRAEIVGGALAGRDLEMLWVDDPIDAFFVQIQGSGRVTLVDGGELRIGYAGQNGHPYTSIGRVLIDAGALDRDTVSMQSIRAWLEANPGRAEAVLNRNRSFVFFRALDGEGPLGAQGVALTAGRSLAVDRRFVPLSVPVWLDTTAPAPAAGGQRPLRRLMVAQDTGGAIRGPVRGDVFWGHGTDAASVAGRMASSGRYFLLLPRNAAAF